MNEYKVTLKNGEHLCAKCNYVDTMTIHSMLNDREMFIKIGDKVFAKDSIVMIEKTEREN